MTIRIITDSGCDLSEEICEKHNISYVPLSVSFDGVEYVDRTNIDARSFYDLLSQHTTLPVSTAPSPGRFLLTYEDLRNRGATDIIYVALSENTSGALESARIAALSIDDVNIHIFNTRLVSSAQGTLVLKAAEAAKNGATVDQIIELLTDLRERSSVFAALDTLENAKKGGRITNMQAIVGSLLSIKPILTMDEEGSVTQLARPRTRKKSFQWLIDQVPEGSTDFAINHGYAEDIYLLAEMLGEPIERIGTIGPVVGVHGGHGAISFSYIAPPKS